MQRTIYFAILLIAIVLVLIVVVIINPPSNPGGGGGVGVGASLDIEHIPRSPVDGLFTYAAKFACGTIPAESDRPDFPSLQGRQALQGAYGAYAGGAGTRRLPDRGQYSQSDAS